MTLGGPPGPWPPAGSAGEGPEDPACEPASRRRAWRGVSASAGVALGPVVRLAPVGARADARPVANPAANPVREDEVRRLTQAMDASDGALATQAQDARNAGSAALVEVLESQRMMVRDPLLLTFAMAALEEGWSAEWAVQRTVDALAERLSRAADPYLRERARDLLQVGDRLLGALDGAPPPPAVPTMPSILVGSELAPADLLAWPRARLLGLVLEHGTATDHTAIVARALGIPSVVGVEGGVHELEEGAEIMVDALRGVVVLGASPEERVEAEVRRLRHAQRLERRRDGRRVSAALEMLDGARVELLANADRADAVAEAKAEGAAGIGLCRTELLEPCDDEMRLTSLYTEFVERAATFGPVTLRTFDVGADKPAPGTRASSAAATPFGARGLRASLADPLALSRQLRAMVRAGAAGAGVRILFPMVTTLEEWRAAKALVRQAQDRVRDEGGPAMPVSVGVMIEVPSAALMADHFAAECDFFSVGTNDLMQYTLATSRHDVRSAQPAQPLEPALLRLLAPVHRAAHAAGIPATVCGELAADPVAVPVLLGLGYRSLSVAPPALALVREIVERVSAAQCEEVARACLGSRTAAEATACVRDGLAEALGVVWEDRGR